MRTAVGRRLRNSQPESPHSQSIFTADPLEPVKDPHDSPGAHDYRAIESRKDLLTFDSDPLSEDLWIAGDIAAVIHASCDCRDFDLWVRLQDVHPDGRAFNVMSPGNDVLRASYRNPGTGRELLEPGRIHELRASEADDEHPVREGAPDTRPDFGLIRPAPVAQPANRRIRDRFFRCPDCHDHDSPWCRPSVETAAADPD